MQIKTFQPITPRGFYKDTSMERQGELYRIVRKLPADFSIQGLDKLVQEGKIHSYSRQGDQFVIYSTDATMLDHIASLPKVKNLSPILEKAKEIFLPPNMNENVAPEYLRYRAWSLGSSVAGSAISFASLGVGMDAAHIALGKTEKIVLAQTINTYAWRLTAMGASFMGQKSDEDPRRYYTVNNLISLGNSLAVLGVLSVLPKSYMPLALGTSILGAFGSSLGGGANVNIFNHMAKQNKGLVSSKNSVQELMASMLGAPVALGIRWGAHKLGISPALATVGVLGPVQFVCAMQAATAIRMEPVSRPNLERLADGYLDTGNYPAAPQTSFVGNLKSLFAKNPKEVASKVQFCDKMDDVIADNANPQELFGVFSGQKYLLGLDGKTGQVRLGLRRDAQLEDAFKAYTQARLLERSVEKLLPAVRDLVGAEKAPNALVELIHRGINAVQGAGQAMGEQGWHNNVLHLKFPLLQAEWKGDAGAPKPPVSREELLAQVAAPDKDRLSQLLGLTKADNSKAA